MIGSRSLALATIAIVGVAVALACTALGPIAQNVCGNAIVEPGEQCDTFVDAGVCLGPDAGARACHLQCGFDGLCPKGSSCGTDQICRQPKGAFVAGAFVADDVRSLVMADFDGDGLTDVVSRGAGVARVHFFDETATLVDTAQVDLQRGVTAATGKVTSDGLASLLVFDNIVAPAAGRIAGTGLQLWRGQVDRTLQAALFKSFPIPGNVTDARTIAAVVLQDSTHPGADDILVYADGFQPGKYALAYLDPVGTNPFQLMALRSSGSTPVAGDIPVARVTATATCDSVVIGYPKELSATLITTCAGPKTPNGLDPDAGAGAMLVPPTILTFPQPIGGPLFVVDADGDGNLDVLTTVTQQPTSTIEVAHGDGNGGFAAGIVSGVLPIHGTVLGVGDLDNDGKLDCVDDDGVLLASAPQQHIPSSGALTYAKVIDLNHDGLKDVVAISKVGIDVYVATGTPAMNHRFYDVPNATKLTVGDCDGDLDQDLLVSAGDGPASLSVLYGNPSGFPDDPIPIGSVSSTISLNAGLLTWFFGDPSDSIASFVIMSRDANGVEVVPVQGHSDRQLTSPLVLSHDQLTNRQIPLNGAVGLVGSGDTTMTSLAMLGTPPIGAASDASLDALPLTVWTAPASSDPTTVFDLENSDAGSLLTSTITGAAGVGMAAVDLDPPQIDGDELVIVLPGDKPNAGTLTIAKYAAGTWQVVSTQPFNGLMRTLSVVGALVSVRVSTADFDGDGLKDVLIVAGDPSDSKKLAVTVMFNDGQGHLTDAATLAVGDAGGAAAIHASPDTTMQVVGVGPSGGKLFSLNPGTRTFDAGRDLGITVVQPGTTTDGGADVIVDVAAGDVNGDGVDDIVVGRGGNTGGFQLFLGQAVVP